MGGVSRGLTSLRRISSSLITVCHRLFVPAKALNYYGSDLYLTRRNVTASRNLIGGEPSPLGVTTNPTQPLGLLTTCFLLTCVSARDKVTTPRRCRNTGRLRSKCRLFFTVNQQSFHQPNRPSTNSLLMLQGVRLDPELNTMSLPGMRPLAQSALTTWISGNDGIL